MAADERAALARAARMVPVEEPERFVNAEESVLSAMLFDADAVAQVRALDLRVDDFNSSKRATVFRALLALDERGSAIDPVTLAAELGPKLESVGGKNFIGYLIDVVPTAANVTHHAKLVLNYAKSRGLADRLEADARALRADTSPPDEVATRLRPALDLIGATPQRFALLDDAELGELARPEWVIGSIIPSNALIVVVAPPKSLKSFLALDWAWHIATGLPWHGFDTQRGEVVYIYAEGTTGLQGRVAALKTYHRVSGRIGIVFLPRRVLINEQADTTSLLGAIKAKCTTPPRIIIIDTLARNMAGDENSTEAMSAFVRGCDELREETGASIVVIHHSGHAADGRGRGSSVLPAAADTHIQCTRDGERIQLECKFQKDAPEFGTLALEAIPIGASLVLKPIGLNSGSLTGNRFACLAAVQENFDDDGAKHKAWKEATGLPASSFNAAANWLKANGYVKAGSGGKYRPTDVGRQALSPKSNVSPSLVHSSESGAVQHVGVYKDPTMDQDCVRDTKTGEEAA